MQQADPALQCSEVFMGILARKLQTKCYQLQKNKIKRNKNHQMFSVFNKIHKVPYLPPADSGVFECIGSYHANSVPSFYLHILFIFIFYH